jgi:hypothetical protein
METEGIPRPAEEGGPDQRKLTLKEKAAFQLKEFLGMFLYIWVLSATLGVYESMILAQQHLNYTAQGFAIINALILAKVLLIGEDLHLGTRLFRDKRLIYAILYRCLIFTLFIVAFHFVEEAVGGMFRGRTMAEIFPAIGAGSLKAILSRGVVVFVALIPFFTFREVGKVIGKRELWSLLLARGTGVYTLQPRSRQ